MENGHLDEGDDSMLKDWRADGSKENNKDIAQMLSPFGEKKVKPKKKTKEKELNKSMPLWKSWLEKGELWDKKTLQDIKGLSDEERKQYSKDQQQKRQDKEDKRDEKWDKATVDQKRRATESGNKRYAGEDYDGSDSKWQAGDPSGMRVQALDEDKVSHSSGHKLRMNPDEQHPFSDSEGGVDYGARGQLGQELGNIAQREGVGKQPQKKITEGVQALKSKQYGKPLYGVTSLEKEGDGAGNTGVNSTDTVGVYNARYSDNNGRYRDQERDTDKEGDEKDDGRRSRD